MRKLVLWFMLNKSGYETRLEFKGKDITISVFSFDLVYGVPQSKGKGGYFIDLTSFQNDIDYYKWEPFRLNFNPNKKEEIIPFSFAIPAQKNNFSIPGGNSVLNDTGKANKIDIFEDDSISENLPDFKDTTNSDGSELPSVFESKIVEKEISFTHNGS